MKKLLLPAAVAPRQCHRLGALGSAGVDPATLPSRPSPTARRSSSGRRSRPPTTAPKEIVDAARSKGVFAMEAMWTRFLPVVAAAREVVAWGRIGDVFAVQGDLCAYRESQPEHRLFAKDLGGGAILDLGVYVVNFAQAFLGDLKEIDSRARLFPSGVEKAASFNLVHAGGGLSSLAAGFDGYGPGRMVVIGTRGWIETEPRLHHPSMIAVHRNDVLPRIIEAVPTGRG